MVKFLSRWPQLFDENRVLRAVTPLFVAKKKGKKTKYFYSFEEYENGKSEVLGYEVTYIKGLGSLEEEDYAEAVILNPHFINVKLDNTDKLEMAFGDDSSLRKEWMME